MPDFYTRTIILIKQLGEIDEKQLSVFGSKGGQICPLMHVPLYWLSFWELLTDQYVYPTDATTKLRESGHPHANRRLDVSSPTNEDGNGGDSTACIGTVPGDMISGRMRWPVGKHTTISKDVVWGSEMPSAE